jgi:epoxyqueuosine reductase
VAKRENPALVLPEARTVISVGATYHTRPLPARFRDDPSRGIIASYAWGDDYHDPFASGLQNLARLLEDELGSAVAHRAYTDTGPILERDLAARCGLGFIGKNSSLIQPRLGSWLLLGELLVSAELPRTVSLQRMSEEAEPRADRGTCGECTRCLEACPTGALVAPYVLDSRRCISYLTIELKGSIPHELRPLMGNRIFGCDICQEVCPWNRRSAVEMAGRASQFAGDAVAPHLLDLLELDERAFSRRFGSSPIRRAKRRGLLRNVCVAVGNWGEPSAVLSLVRNLADAEPLIRGHASWALGRIGTQEAIAALGRAQGDETDDWVRDEMRQACLQSWP